jgi:hypothetical protein
MSFYLRKSNDEKVRDLYLGQLDDLLESLQFCADMATQDELDSLTALWHVPYVPDGETSDTPLPMDFLKQVHDQAEAFLKKHASELNADNALDREVLMYLTLLSSDWMIT